MSAALSYSQDFGTFTLPFQHQSHVHCESGATVNLLKYYGLNISEAMLFGLGSGLYFVHTPLVKALNAPITTFRYFPGTVFKQAAKLLNIEVGYQTFSNQKVATKELDKKLADKYPVGLLTNMFYLEYMPEIFRFHFSAHNLIAYGKEQGKYLISDSMLEIPVVLDEDKLLRARFGKGMLNPKGKMYWVKSVPEKIDYASAIPQAIRLVCKRMLRPYYTWAGYRGIVSLSKKIARYPKYGEEKAAFLLLNIVRMQEVVGTGGSGFRNIYAVFLKEAADTLQSTEMLYFAEKMSLIAEEWREFGKYATRCAKKRYVENEMITYQDVGKKLYRLAMNEKNFFLQLNQFVKSC